MDDEHHVAGDRAARAATSPGFVDEVLERIRDDGPIAAGDLEQRVGTKGSWWDWDDGKIALEHLFHHGQVVGVRRRARLRPALRPARAGAARRRARRARRRPRHEARKELLDARRPQHSASATLEDLADYHRQAQRAVQAARRRARRGGRAASRSTVEGWAAAGVRPPRRRAARDRSTRRALLSPFDSLVWYRERTERLFDFHYRIEIYMPAPKRIYGYYVLPFLLGDGSSGASTSRPTAPRACCACRAPTSSPASTPPTVADRLVEELRLMAGWLELDAVATTSRASWPRRCGEPACPASTP